MSAATIKRGATKRTPRATVKRRARSSAPRKPTAFQRFLAALPVQPQTVERMMTYFLVGLVAAACLGIAILAGIPGYIGTQIALGIGKAGFDVKRVEVTGIDRMERLTVYAIALDQHSTAMPLVDLSKVRNQLMQYGWIADARVYRRLPDTLVVDIVERKPAAIWQHSQKLSLIDAEGVILEKVSVDNMPDLPLIVGDKANEQASNLGALIQNAPRLKPMIASATWVGNRRWDLRFQSGETLALPEGEDFAGQAFTRFSKMDGLERLLGRGFARFDMRDPKKFVVRLSREREKIDDAAKPASET